MPRASTPVPTDPLQARQAAQGAALRLLAGREMSTARVRERLRSRGFPEAAIDETVARLTAAGVLDDRRAALAAARTLVAVRLRGRHRVGRELERLGFEHALAIEATQSVVGDTDERSLIDRVVASKMRGGRSIPDPATYRRLYGSLLRRGFPADLIRATLRPHWGRRSDPVE